MLLKIAFFLLLHSFFSFLISPLKLNLIKASSTPTSSYTTVFPTTKVLNEKFDRKGIKFLETNNQVPMVELIARNGSSSRLQNLDAHFASYKPKVYWKDDSFEEVLYTILAAGGIDNSKFRDGIGLVMNEVLEVSPKGPITFFNSKASLASTSPKGSNYF